MGPSTKVKAALGWDKQTWTYLFATGGSAEEV